MTKSQVSKHPYLTGNALIKVFEEADIRIQNMSKGVLTYYGFAKIYRVQPQIALYKLPKDIIPNPNRVSFEERYPVDFWYDQFRTNSEIPLYRALFRAYSQYHDTASMEGLKEEDISTRNMWSEEDFTSLEFSGVTNLTNDTATTTTTTTTTMKPSISVSSDEYTQSTVPELRNIWRSTLYPPSTSKVVFKPLGNNTPVQAEDDGIYRVGGLGLGIPEHTELPEYMQVSKRSPAKRQLIKGYTNAK